MPKVPLGKKYVHVYIGEKTLEKFLSLMEAKADGSMYGSLSRGIEVAMEEYIASHSTLTAHTHVYLNPGFPQDKTVCLQILQALMKRGIDYEFVQRDLVDAVAQVRGSDKRTVKHWLDRLLHYEFIAIRYGGVGETGTLMDPKWARRLEKNPIYRILYHPKGA